MLILQDRLTTTWQIKRSEFYPNDSLPSSHAWTELFLAEGATHLCEAGDYAPADLRNFPPLAFAICVLYRIVALCVPQYYPL